MIGMWLNRECHFFFFSALFVDETLLQDNFKFYTFKNGQSEIINSFEKKVNVGRVTAGHGGPPECEKGQVPVSPADGGIAETKWQQ